MYGKSPEFNDPNADKNLYLSHFFGLFSLR